MSRLTLTFDSQQDQTPWAWEDGELIGRSESTTLVSHPVDVTSGGLFRRPDSYRNWIPGPVEVTLRLHGEFSDRELRAASREALVYRAGAGTRWSIEVQGWWETAPVTQPA